MRKVMITTLDNPFDPFDEFDDWYNFDETKGYNTTGYVARVAHDSNELSDEDEAVAIEQAVDEIMKFNTTGIYRKLVRET